MHRNLVAFGLICGLTAGNASADLDCGIGRVAMDIDGIVQITPEIGECSLLEHPVVVKRLFPNSQFLFNPEVDEPTCFVGVISGTAAIAGKEINIAGTSLSAQYAGEAFKAFEVEIPENPPIRPVIDIRGTQWLIGDANTYIELTRPSKNEPSLRIAFDDTFFFTPDGNDTEKFVAISPGVNGTLVAEGPIFWPGAPIKGRLCVATSLLY